MELWERIERFFEIWFNTPREIRNLLERRRDKKTKRLIRRIKGLCIKRAFLQEKRKLLKPDAPIKRDLNPELYSIVDRDLELYKTVSFQLISGEQEFIDYRICKIDAKLKKLRFSLLKKSPPK